ncbi:MAG: hypothetical protein F6K41_11710, partial [Symploca sp. SIO3E6]|nr:hypothetical protein [Caldora sp. SIO3E6]
MAAHEEARSRTKSEPWLLMRKRDRDQVRAVAAREEARSRTKSEPW